MAQDRVKWPNLGQNCLKMAKSGSNWPKNGQIWAQIGLKWAKSMRNLWNHGTTEPRIHGTTDSRNHGTTDLHFSLHTQVKTWEQVFPTSLACLSGGFRGGGQGTLAPAPDRVVPHFWPHFILPFPGENASKLTPSLCYLLKLAGAVLGRGLAWASWQVPSLKRHSCPLIQCTTPMCHWKRESCTCTTTND